MKNIYLIPTQNKSVLTKNNLGELYLLNGYQHQVVNENQNMYITYDDEIKVGDWYLFFMSTYTELMNCQEIDEADRCNNLPSIKDNCVKIVMTTDTILIQDGVQKIPQDFLEWFVENPNCVEVEIHKNSPVMGIVKGVGVKSFDNGYKIIIPSKESKMEINKEYVDDQDGYGYDVSFNEETLDEFSERFAKTHFEDIKTYNSSSIATAVRVGTMWEQKKLYTEDEVKNIVEKTVDKFCPYFSENIKKEASKEWFEQFKKEKNGTKI